MAWWQFWRRKQEPEPWWLDFPPPEPYESWNEYWRENPYDQSSPWDNYLDSWPPSWTDEADEPAPSDITEWALLDEAPSVPAPQDEDHDPGKAS